MVNPTASQWYIWCTKRDLHYKKKHFCKIERLFFSIVLCLVIMLNLDKYGSSVFRSMLVYLSWGAFLFDTDWIQGTQWEKLMKTKHQFIPPSIHPTIKTAIKTEMKLSSKWQVTFLKHPFYIYIFYLILFYLSLWDGLGRPVLAWILGGTSVGAGTHGFSVPLSNCPRTYSWFYTTCRTFFLMHYTLRSTQLTSITWQTRAGEACTLNKI